MLLDFKIISYAWAYKIISLVVLASAIGPVRGNLFMNTTVDISRLLIILL